MKIRSVLIYSFAVMAIACANEELFLKAHQNYIQKDYATALQHYQLIPNKGAAVWYNMGNCAYKMNDFKAALAYWNSAEHVSHDVQQLKAIWLNQKKLAQKIDKEIMVTTKKTYRATFPFYYLKIIPMSFLQLLFLSVWFIVWFLIYRRKKKLVPLMVLVNGICGVGLLIKQEYCQEIALVAMPTAYVYAGPHKSFHQVGTLDMLTEVAVNEQRNDWCKIKNKKIVGWMLTDSITKV